MTTEQLERKQPLALHIEFDQDCESPAEGDLNWKLYSFDRRDGDHKEFSDKWLTENHGLSIGLQSKLKAGTAFWLSCYDHSGVVWSLQGENNPGGWYGQFDYARMAGCLVFEYDASEMGAKDYAGRQKDARDFLNVYNDWVNGFCYGCALENADGEQLDSCFGFIGREAILEAANDALEAGDRVIITGEASFIVDASDLKAGVTVVEGRKHSAHTWAEAS
jgi:hypothetical protein